ncbi:MAG: response regulator [Candidatus Lernaella stagnicola]|nr:response regulator [Candidatus Lernaella stagnicola]
MPKILLIDDDPDFIAAHSAILSGHGYEVISAYDGEEGLAKIQSEKPDLVVLDVMMSTEYEGFDVARKIREDLKLRDLPIIILSSIHEEKKVPYRFAPDDTWLPVDLWLDKPAEPAAFIEKVQQALGTMPQQPG